MALAVGLPDSAETSGWIALLSIVAAAVDTEGKLEDEEGVGSDWCIVYVCNELLIDICCRGYYLVHRGVIIMI